MKPDRIYKIETCHSEGDEVTATVIFNEKHALFGGHFPGNPIVPGVVQVQIIKELVEIKLKQNLILALVKNIKFLSVISPEKNPIIEVMIRLEIDEVRSIHVRASLKSGEIIFMKFVGSFKAMGK